MVVSLPADNLNNLAIEISFQCFEKSRSDLRKGNCEGFNLSEEERIHYSDLPFGLFKRLRVSVRNKENFDISFYSYFKNPGNSVFKIINGAHLSRKNQTLITSEVSILPNQTFSFDIMVEREKSKKFSAQSRESNEFCLEVKIAECTPVVILSREVKEVSHKWAVANKNRRVAGSGSRQILNPYYKKNCGEVADKALKLSPTLPYENIIKFSELDVIGISSKESKETDFSNRRSVTPQLENAEISSRIEDGDNDSSMRDLEIIASEALNDLFVSLTKNSPLTNDKKTSGDHEGSSEAPKSESSSRKVVSRGSSQNISYPYPPSRTLAGSTSQTDLPERQQLYANENRETQSRIKKLNSDRCAILEKMSKNEINQVDGLETLRRIGAEIDALYLKK